MAHIIIFFFCWIIASGAFYSIKWMIQNWPDDEPPAIIEWLQKSWPNE